MDLNQPKIVIGITMRVIEPGILKERMDALDQEWFSFLHRVLPEAVLVPIPNHKESARQLIQATGMNRLILSGGNDWGSAKERDETETLMVEEAKQNGWPVLGVCRGMQVLNALHGGKLETQIKEQSGEEHAGTTHTIRLTANQIFPELMEDEITVNSYHRQGVMVSGLGKDLEAFAFSPSGVIEGFFHKKYPILGIQWHPERKNPAAGFDQKLLAQFFRQTQGWASCR
ncbi:MAG: hypothetical protein EXS63_05280 [Candidatus Omnitrophica bacterium]|nr:hypothetical protein [Candidatus Omnitrophota bacterium]